MEELGFMRNGDGPEVTNQSRKSIEIAGMETKCLNEQVRRNLTRFHEDLMFTFHKHKVTILRSQIATSNWGGRIEGRGNGGKSEIEKEGNQIYFGQAQKQFGQSGHPSQLRLRLNDQFKNLNYEKARSIRVN